MVVCALQYCKYYFSIAHQLGYNKCFLKLKIGFFYVQAYLQNVIHRFTGTFLESWLFKILKLLQLHFIFLPNKFKQFFFKEITFLNLIFICHNNYCQTSKNEFQLYLVSKSCCFIFSCRPKNKCVKSYLLFTILF